ncbi:MAG TPA: AI-2E family transporter [Pseudonocardiaceae bacterium]|jgi:predicted PurR-regulated permease PerM
MDIRGARARRLPRALVLLGGAAATVVVLAGCSAAAWLIGPLFLAIVIVIVINPIPQWLRRHHVPSWLATTLLVVLVYGVIASLVVVLFVSVAQLATLLSHYADDDIVARAAAQLRHWGVGADQARAVAGGLDLRHIVRYVGSVLGSIAGIGTSVVFLLSLLLFLSIDAATADVRRAGLITGRPALGDALRTFVRGTRRYVLVTTVFGLVVAVLDSVGLAALGVSLPVLWGVLAFMTNYIPNIGFVLGVLPPAVLGLLQGGWRLGLAVVVLYGVLNFVVQSLIQPRFVGNAVGLSTTATFVSLVLWSWILGPPGAILAVPLTLLAKALLIDPDPRATWVTALVGSIPTTSTRTR